MLIVFVYNDYQIDMPTRTKTNRELSAIDAKLQSTVSNWIAREEKAFNDDLKTNYDSASILSESVKELLIAGQICRKINDEIETLINRNSTAVLIVILRRKFSFYQNKIERTEMKHIIEDIDDLRTHVRQIKTSHYHKLKHNQQYDYDGSTSEHENLKQMRNSYRLMSWLHHFINDEKVQEYHAEADAVQIMIQEKLKRNAASA